MPTRREFLAISSQAAAEFAALGATVRVGRAAPQSSRKIRIGVVGGGFGASFQWHEHPNCIVAAVSDLRADRREILRDRYGCDSVYDSLEDMLRPARNLDAMAVFTGAPDHYRHVEMCMKRGLHVISAVPSVMTLEEAEKLKQLKESTGLRYMMAETSYYRMPTIYARSLFGEGRLGELFYTELEYYHDGGERLQLVQDKRSRLYEPGGSRSWRWGLPPMNYPTHSLGFLVGVTRERITRVSCLGWGPDEVVWRDNSYRNPFSCQAAIMQTDRGHMSRCNVFWVVAGIAERAQWFGSKGTLYMQNMDVHEDSWKPNEQDGQVTRVTIPEYWKSNMLPEPLRHNSGHGDSHVFLTAEFINALVEDREPAVNVYEALAMTVPGIVAHDSSLKNGEQLKVPSFDRASG
jgi:predicted dehydrogenase